MSPLQSNSPISFLASFVVVALTATACAAVRNDPYGSSKALHFIRTSCTATDYPNLCFSSLSGYAGTIRTDPIQLAQAALSVSLTGARATATSIAKTLKSGGVGAKEAGAISDCVDNIGDSVEELRKTIKEMGGLRKSKNFKLCISDMQTWVSSALTDENTCMEEFPSSSMALAARNSVRDEIVKAAQLTSNALSLINGLSGV